MQSSLISTCKLVDFDNCNSDIFYDSLYDFNSKYPFIEESHKQDFYSILLLNSCHGEIEIDNHKIYFNSPKVVIIKPNCIFKINLHPEASGKIISFTETFFSLRYNNNALNDFSFFENEQTCKAPLESGSININSEFVFFLSETICLSNSSQSMLAKPLSR